MSKFGIVNQNTGNKTQFFTDLTPLLLNGRLSDRQDVALYDYGTSSWNLQVYGAELVARTSGGTGAISAAQSTFFLYDHLGNTRVSYKSGNSTTPADIQYAADYFPYGKILREFANGAIEKHLTTGHERDQETGLDYRGARYYDSDLARFLSVDSAGETKF